MKKCPSCNNDLFILIDLQNNNDIFYVCENDLCNINYLNENGELVNERE